MPTTTEETVALRLLMMRDLAREHASVCRDPHAKEGLEQLSQMADETQKLMPRGIIGERIPPLRPEH